MRIAVMGAGGIGGYLGGRLAAVGEDVTFVARGAHLEALRQNGLRIESPFGDLHLPQVRATDAPAEIGSVDLVLFTVKLYDSEPAAAALGPLIGPHPRGDTAERHRQPRHSLAVCPLRPTHRRVDLELSR